MTDTTNQTIKAVLGYQLRTGCDVQTGAETNAPTVIWADADYEVGDGTCGLHETQKPANEPAIPYVRFDTLRALLAERDEARAETAAILEKAAKSIECLLPEGGSADPQDATDRLIDTTRRDDVRAIRALIDTDHSAALADVVQAAVEKERERCAKIADDEDMAITQWGQDQNTKVAQKIAGDIAAAIRKGEET